MNTDKERIRNEIERLIDILERNSGCTGVFGDSQMAAYEKILSFIDSMQEEPMSEDLEEACNSYYDETWDEHGGKAMVVDGCHDIWFPSLAPDDFFKAGAQWQKEQMMKDAIECNIGWYDGLLLDYTQQQQDKALDKIGAKIGDKVKVIIIKEE